MTMQQFERDSIVSTLGENLTSTFGLKQLPNLLAADQPYETKSRTGGLIVTSVRYNRLSIADGHDPSDTRLRNKKMANAVFAAESTFPRSLEFALYTRRNGMPKNYDFVGYGREFMVRAHQYFLEVLTIPLTTIVASWFKGQQNFDAFARVYDPHEKNIIEALSHTWSAPIIMNTLGYRYPHAEYSYLQDLAREENIRFEFTKSPQ